MSQDDDDQAQRCRADSLTVTSDHDDGCSSACSGGARDAARARPTTSKKHGMPDAGAGAVGLGALRISSGVFEEDAEAFRIDREQFIEGLAPLNQPARESAAWLHALYDLRRRWMRLQTLALEAHGYRPDAHPEVREMDAFRTSTAATLLGAAMTVGPLAIYLELSPRMPEMILELAQFAASFDTDVAAALDTYDHELEVDLTELERRVLDAMINKYGSVPEAVKALRDKETKALASFDRVLEGRSDLYGCTDEEIAALVARDLLQPKSGFTLLPYPVELDEAIARGWKQFQAFQAAADPAHSRQPRLPSAL